MGNSATIAQQNELCMNLKNSFNADEKGAIIPNSIQTMYETLSITDVQKCDDTNNHDDLISLNIMEIIKTWCSDLDHPKDSCSIYYSDFLDMFDMKGIATMTQQNNLYQSLKQIFFQTIDKDNEEEKLFQTHKQHKHKHEIEDTPSFEIQNDDLINNNNENKISLQEKVFVTINKWCRKVTLENSTMYCNFLDIEETLIAAFATGLTPLIIDTSPDEKLCTYYNYQPDVILLECKNMILEYSRLPLVKCLESARQRLVNAMKFGKLLALRMGSSAPDFKNTFHDGCLHPNELPTVLLPGQPQPQAYFPREVLINAGKPLKSDGWADKIFREEDMKPHKNFALCRDTFRVCLISQLKLEDIDEYLFGDKWGGLPDRNLFQIVCINHDAEDV